MSEYTKRKHRLVKEKSKSLVDDIDNFIYEYNQLINYCDNITKRLGLVYDLTERWDLCNLSNKELQKLNETK